MVQTYKIILWRRPEAKETSFEEIAHRIYDTLCVLQRYDEIFRPNYLTVWKKSDASKFEWSYKSFSENLKNKVIKIEGEEKPELGYTSSFFSSLNDDESCGIRFTVGIKDNKFVNSLVINLPYSIDYSEEEKSIMLRTMFSELVSKFEPYWGCVCSNKFEIDNLRLLSGNTPLYLHWLNYWSKDVESTVSGKFFKKIQKMKDISYKDGILQISKNALNDKNNKDIEFFKKINDVFFITGNGLDVNR